MNGGNGNPRGRANSGRFPHPHTPANGRRTNQHQVPRSTRPQQSTNAGSSRGPSARSRYVDSYRPSQHQGTNYQQAQSSLNIAGGFNNLGLASNAAGSTRQSQGSNVPSRTPSNRGSRPQSPNTATNQPAPNAPYFVFGSGDDLLWKQNQQSGNAYQFTGLGAVAGPTQQHQPLRTNSPRPQWPANAPYQIVQDILVDGNNVFIGNGPVHVGRNPGPWNFSPAQNQRAKSRDWKVGDVVSHEVVRQAWNDPDWHWIDQSLGLWKYNSKDIFFVPGKERLNRDSRTVYGHQTVPAVQFLNRFGVIDEIYEDDALYGRSARVIPMFSYGGSGMYDKSTGRAKQASWCAEHLPIMHHTEAEQKEQDIQNRSDIPEEKDKTKALDRKCPHPDIFWKDLVRLTADSFFHPEQGSHLRLSATTMVQLQDPRIKYMGELTPDSWAFVRGARAKIQEIASLGPEDRGNVDYSVYTWMENLDKNKVLHRQQRRQTQSAQASSASSSPRGSDTVATNSEQPTPATSRKRKASELNSAPDPVKVETENVLNFRFLLQNMSVEERRQALGMMQDTRQTSDDVSVAMSIETAATDVEEEVEPAAKRTKLNDAVDSKTDDSARQGSEEGETLEN